MRGGELSRGKLGPGEGVGSYWRLPAGDLEAARKRAGERHGATLSTVVVSAPETAESCATPS
jgi:hypothetical protein